MAVTETTTIGWGSRLGSSVKGILVGLALFVIGFPVLFWNEGRTVTATKTNEEGAASVVEADARAVDAAQEGMLVHVIGDATTQDVLTDDEYGVSAEAIQLDRLVEMYQWVEHADTREEKKVGGKVERTTTYTYAKEWRAAAVESDGFREPGHVNPPARRALGASRLYAKDVKLGARRLTDAQIRAIGGREPLVVKYQPVTTNEFFDVAGTVPEPRVGDIRATFTVVRPHTVTVVAAQRGETFMPYTAKGTRQTISHVMDGAVDAEGVFAAAEKGNRTLAWLIRLGGFLLMFIGVSMVLKPLSVLADVLPILGNIVGVGIGLVAFAVAAPCALVTIAVAWFFYRPVLAVALLVAAAAIVYWAWSRKKAKKPAPAVG